MLGTLQTQQGSSAIINAIIAANNGVIHDTHSFFDNGMYTLSVNDFNDQGQASWWGAQAFVHYLNSIDYAGKTNWALPTTPDTNASGLGQTSSQLGELYHNELGFGQGGIFGNDSTGQANIVPFSSVQVSVYWSGTELASDPSTAWYFGTYDGGQYIYPKYFQFYSWPVSSGNVAAVPVPGAVWLFLTGGLALLGLSRRGNIG